MDAWTPEFGEILQEGPWLRDEEPSSPVPANDLADAFRTSMRRLAAGTSVVTVRHRGEIKGVTATSVTSLSMEPPSILVSIRSTSSIMAALREERRFTVHLLAEDQAHQANVFAGRFGNARRDSLVEWDHDGNDPQRLAGATCHIDCRVARFMPVYSHVIAVGVVQKVDVAPNERPLVYFDGAFHSLADGKRED